MYDVDEAVHRCTTTRTHQEQRRPWRRRGRRPRPASCRPRAAPASPPPPPTRPAARPRPRSCRRSSSPSGSAGRTRFETTTDSEAASAATTSSTNDVQPKSTEPRWKKISAEPPSAITAPATARPLRRSIRCATASSSVSSGPTAITTAAIPAGTSCIAQYRQPYAIAKASSPYSHHQAEHAAARERQPQRHDQHAEDGRRQAEAETGAPQRVELPVRVPDRDEVRAADDDGADERGEGEAVGRIGGCRRRGDLPTVQRRDR